MPLKLSIAMSRKVGEANYGSRGATVGLEMEVDGSLIDQPAQLHERIAGLFLLARESVNTELSAGTPQKLEPAAAQGAPPRPAIRPVTAAQPRAVYALANYRQVDLAGELASRFGVDRPDDLTLEQASALIDALRLERNGAARP